jgi:hypothetical protein
MLKLVSNNSQPEVTTTHTPNHKVTITKSAITITSDEVLEPHRLLGLLNDYPEAMKVMPEDYDFIINEEGYPKLFAFGSPQMMECGWKIKVEYSEWCATLTLTNFS